MAFRNKRRTSTPIPKSSRSTLVVISAAKPAAKVTGDSESTPVVIRDEAAYARNCQRLLKEYEAKNPKTVVMMQLLTETHPERRKQIVASPETTSNLLKIFPVKNGYVNN